MTEAILRQIKGTSLAYPLFRIAKLFLEEPERHMVKLHMREGALYQCRTGGPVAPTPASLARSLFDARASDFYRLVVEEGEEIKGVFTSVARCGLSGELLGPPNHHSYQNNLRAVYAKRFASRMSFDAYRVRVTVLSDPEMVAKWKDSVRRRERFVYSPPTPAEEPPAAPEPTGAADGAPNQRAAGPFDPEPSHQAPAESSETAAPGTAYGVAPALDTAVEPETEPAPETSAAATDAEEPSSDPAAFVENASPSGESASEEAPSGDEPAASVGAKAQPIDPNAIGFDTREEAFRHFENEVLPTLLTQTTDVELLGRDALAIDDPAIREALHLAWENEMRFPQNISKEIATVAAKVGLHIFKHEKRFLHLAGTRPTPVPSDLNRLSSGIRKVVDILRETPRCTRPRLLNLVLASTPGVTDSVRETIKSSLASDLRWLIAAGHVIEFSGGMLHLVEARNPSAHPRPHTAPPKKQGQHSKGRTKDGRKSEAARVHEAPRVDEAPRVHGARASNETREEAAPHSATTEPNDESVSVEDSAAPGFPRQDIPSETGAPAPELAGSAAEDSDLPVAEI